MADSLGTAFARALGAKDREAITALLTDDIDFKAMTPRKFWEADEPGGVLEVLLGNWFGDQDGIEAVLSVEDAEPVEDTAQVSYRFALSTPDGPHTAAQTAYYRTDGDRISYLRVMCSGFRPAG